jgi:hypothetical protein
MKIKKNDKVTLNTAHKLPYGDKSLPPGTELIVWKAQRDGTLNCSTKATCGSVYVKADNVTLMVRNCPMPKVGDLFYSSWGYEQTNIDFYQVTAVNKKMVDLTPIAGERKYGQPMAGNVKPVLNKFTGDSKAHLVRFDGEDQPYFRLNSYSSAWPTTADESHFFSEWH